MFSVETIIGIIVTALGISIFCFGFVMIPHIVETKEYRKLLVIICGMIITIMGIILTAAT